MSSPKNNLPIRLLYLLAVLIISIIRAPYLHAAPPAWWTPNVIASTKQANDYAAVNQGQLKNIAAAAMAEMDVHLPGGAGPIVHQLVGSWGTSRTQANDYASVNLGTLKTVAQPFCDRLTDVGYIDAYPWNESATPASDYAAANIGQVKNLFSFDLTTVTAANDLDGDGIADWWEQWYFPRGGADPAAFCPSGNGMTLAQAFAQGIDPTGFGGSAPVFAIVSGDGQTSAPNTLAPAPLVVSVKDSNNNPLTNVPVTFHIMQGGGSVQQTATSSPAASTTVFTDSNGQASVLYAMANDEDIISRIQASDVNGLFWAPTAFTEISTDSSDTNPSASSDYFVANAATAPTDDGSTSINDEVTTAGMYNPYDGNATRVITDLTVPGSNGVYPLAFTRYSNSRRNYDIAATPVFGDCGNWRHSYQWSLLQSGNTYTLLYPDGRANNFVFGNNSSYAKGSMGTQDQLEVLSDRSWFYLHMSDGGIVAFKNDSNNVLGIGIYAASITDPYGAVTTLTYNGPSPGLVTVITEPGGRTLALSYLVYVYYLTVNGNKVPYYVYVLGGVSSGNQSVGYIYPPNQIQVNSKKYLPLIGVQYNQETDNGTGAPLCAQYTYYYGKAFAKPSDIGTPVLYKVVDPHYAGAMTSIQYGFSDSDWGKVTAEQYYSTAPNAPQFSVSSLITQSNADGSSNSTEARGDASATASGSVINRFFQFGKATNPDGTSTYAAKYLPTSITDFQGNSTYIYYDPSGNGYVEHVVDANGHVTSYTTEPYTGKVLQTIKHGLTGNDVLTSSAVWGNQTGSTFTPTTNIATTPSTCTQPYYLYQTTDERNQTTYYARNPDSAPGTGLVSKVTYPDGSTESYTYRSFTYGGNSFYKVQTYTNKLGAVYTYAYDEDGSGGSGYPGLLTSVTCMYNDQSDGGGASHTEKTTLSYNGRDLPRQVWDQRGVSDSFKYNGRNQVQKVTHASAMPQTNFTYKYDNYGRCVQSTDELKKTTVFTYDDYGRVTLVTEPVNYNGVTNRSTQYRYERRDANSTPLFS